MILNHKDAIRYVVGNLDAIEVSAWDLRNIHALLADQLISDPVRLGGLRRLPVAISRSTYSPPEDEPTIREEFDALVRTAARIEDPFEQSFFLLVLTETNAVLYGLGPGDLAGLEPSDSP